MTRSTIELMAFPEDHRIAKMAAYALALTLLETGIPSPLPGVKPGLANIVTLVVLARYGLRFAVWVSLLRVVCASLLIGTFLSPSFFLSLSGAIASLVMLACTRVLPCRLFGPVSHSILAALAHIAGQLAVVYLWLIPHPGIFYLAPVFAAAALMFGTVNGLVAAKWLESANDEPRLAGAAQQI
ncbi:MAG TPA: Gx transporter family protein [Burkholderiales bacterium]|nr:Gx transporter family protein [Burkholderiales bacterium]